jgi:hypothetical protein
MTKEPIKINVAPAEAGANKSSNGVSEQQMWEQMCHIQSDMRNLLRESQKVTDISKQMLSEQQQMRAQTERLIDKVATSVDKMTDLIEKTNLFMEKNDRVMDQVAVAITSLETAVKANDDNVDSIVDEMMRVIDENQINMDELSDSISTIAQASLTVAYSLATDDAAVDVAQQKAAQRIIEDHPENELMRIAIRENRQLDREVAREKLIKERATRRAALRDTTS